MKQVKQIKKKTIDIVYSKYESSTVTADLDYTLDTRDKLLFQTIFRGCRIAYLKHEEYRRKEQGADKSLWSRLIYTLRSGYFWISVLFLFVLWLFTIVCYYKAIGFRFFEMCLAWDIPMAAICICVYVGWFRTVEFPIYWGRKKDMVIWEDRKDHRGHLLVAPVFFRLCKDPMISAKKTCNSQTKLLSDCYLETARDLSWLRCLCLISEKIESFVKFYGEENIEVEIWENEGCNDEDRNGIYTIILTGTIHGDADAIIPTDVQTDKCSFELPFVIGEKMVKKYHNFGILDLAVLDQRYEKIMESGIIVKKENHRRNI